jgi:hypothetical protein
MHGYRSIGNISKMNLFFSPNISAFGSMQDIGIEMDSLFLWVSIKHSISLYSSWRVKDKRLISKADIYANGVIF